MERNVSDNCDQQELIQKIESRLKSRLENVMNKTGLFNKGNSTDQG